MPKHYRQLGLVDQGNRRKAEVNRVLQHCYQLGLVDQRIRRKKEVKRLKGC